MAAAKQQSEDGLMPRKRTPRLSPEDTDAVFDAILDSTQLARQERELAIMRVCQILGADPNSEDDRHKVFGYLAYFAPHELLGIRLPPGPPKGSSTTLTLEDVRVLQRAADLAIAAIRAGKIKGSKEQKQIISKALGDAIKAAERDGTLPARERTTHKKRLGRRLREMMDGLGKR
jgi:hypothetical protein